MAFRQDAMMPFKTEEIKPELSRLVTNTYKFSTRRGFVEYGWKGQRRLTQARMNKSKAEINVEQDGEHHIINMMTMEFLNKTTGEEGKVVWTT